MDIRQRTYDYDENERFNRDYHKVHDFLHRVNPITDPANLNFTWGRWAWMISRPVDDEGKRSKIGIWEDGGTIVALVTHELGYGHVYMVVDPAYAHLKQAMVRYAKSHLRAEDGMLRIIIDDRDDRLQAIALSEGFIPIEKHERLSIKYMTEAPEVNVPEGYSLVSMDEEWDYGKYADCLFYGFDHEGEPRPDDEDDLYEKKTMLSSPYLDKRLMVVAKDRAGHYVSHAGLWHLRDDEMCYVEPVCTVPGHRKKGLGKACLSLAMRRAYENGARYGVVGNTLQFYHNQSFLPKMRQTWWEWRP